MQSSTRRRFPLARKALRTAVALLAVALIVALVKTVPELSLMLTEQSKELPALLATTLKVGEFLRSYGWFLLAASIPVAVYNRRTTGSWVGIESVKSFVTVLVLEIVALALVAYAVAQPILEIGEI